MKKIVITGGPCAGKSTALPRIKEYFEKKEYTVYIVSETATELIQSGVTPTNAPSALTFQVWLTHVQLAKEKVIEQMAKQTQGKVLVVCDRGLLDNKAYLTESEYQIYLEQMHLQPEDINKRYDAIFHLESAACGAEAFYTTQGDSVRDESIEQARTLDSRHKEIGSQHPCFVLIQNDGSFEDKMERLLKEIEKYVE